MYHTLLKTFPSFAKPSYETVVHKKVFDAHYDHCVAIPYGKRAFLWFTHYQGKDMACIVEIGRNQNLQDNIHILDIGFPKSFALGTLLSGYLIEHVQSTPSHTDPNTDKPINLMSDNSVLDDEALETKHFEHKYFVADDIFQFCGYEFGNPFPYTMNQKWEVFRDFFQQFGMDQRISRNYSIHSIVFWKPETSQFLNTIPEHWKSNIGYSIKIIQYRSSVKILPHLNMASSKNIWTFSSPHIIPDSDSNTITDTVHIDDVCSPETNMALAAVNAPTTNGGSVWDHKMTTAMPTWNLNIQHEVYRGKKIFWVSAELAYDVYILYAKHRKMYQYAYIPDQKTSIMMNGLFRNIPENACLDKIEESEDEDEFENIHEDKYLKQQTPILMECIFHRKFRKWIPIRTRPEHLAKYIPDLEELVLLDSPSSSSSSKPRHQHHHHHRPKRSTSNTNSYGSHKRYTGKRTFSQN